MHAFNDRRASARFWRSFVLLGGLVLASTYFMPAIDCSGLDGPKVNPSQEFRHFVRDEARAGFSTSLVALTATRWLGHVMVFVVPYAFGALVAVAALLRFSRSDRPRRFVTRLLASFYVTSALAVLYCAAFGYELCTGEVRFAFDDSNLGRCLYGPLLVIVYALVMLHYGERGHFGLTFIGSVLCLFWFWKWASREPLGTAYGLYFSLAASFVVAAAIALELAAAGRAWFTALPRLLLGVLPRCIRDDGGCPACGYQLYGCPGWTCPECGQPFHEDEVDGCFPPASNC
jgi:hypothetical protein